MINIMNMNRIEQADSDISLKEEKMAYRHRCEGREVQFQFIQSSQYFLQTSHPFHIKQFEQIIQDYQIKSENGNKIMFLKQVGSEQGEHSQFIKRIQRFLQKYKIFVICQYHSTYKQLRNLKDKITQISEEIGVSKEIDNLSLKQKTMFIYFPFDYQEILVSQIKNYISSIRDKFLFCLNQYIGKKVNFKYYKQFVRKIYLLYKDDLKEICKSKFNDRSIQVNILKISPNLFGANGCSNDWSLQQNKFGLIGLQFEVQGQQWQIVRLYSLIQAFIYNISFTVVSPSQFKLDSNEILCKLRQNQMKVVTVGEQIIVFEPPKNLTLTIEELHQKIWVLTNDDFLNLPFKIISQYKKTFMGILSKKLNINKIKIDEASIEFESDQNTYKQVKMICRTFIFDMRQKSKQIEFITSQQDLEAIKRYYLQGKNHLQWRENAARIQCPNKDLQQNLNSLIKIDKQLGKKKIKIYSKVAVKHPLAKFSIQLLKYRFFPSRYYKAQQNQMNLYIRQISEMYQSEILLYIISKDQPNTQLKELIRRNYGTQHTPSFIQKEISIQYQHKLQSVFLLQVSNMRSIYKVESKVITFLQELINRNKPFRIVLPSQSQDIYTSLLQIILKHLQFRSSVIKTKDIYLYIPSNSSRPLWQRLKQQLKINKFTRVSQYFLSMKQMVEASTLNLVKLSCSIDKKNVICTSLNSFVFKQQLTSKQDKQFISAIFIPKINCKQYLFNLKTQQCYRISNYKVEKLSNYNLFSSTIKIIQKYFINQNYVVLYSSQKNGQDNFLSYLYVYNSKIQGKLRKGKLDLEKQKIVMTDIISFNLSAYQQQSYVYEIHEKAQSQLINLLRNKQ